MDPTTNTPPPFVPIDDHLVVLFSKLCESLPPNILLSFLGALYGILFENMPEDPIGTQIQVVGNQLGQMLHTADFHPDQQEKCRGLINHFAYDHELVDMRTPKKRQKQNEEGEEGAI
jgi:hypothetical protein